MKENSYTSGVIWYFKSY